MWFSPVKKLLYPFGYIRVMRHLGSGMLKPMPGSIFSERKRLQGISGDTLVQVQKGTQTGLDDESMSRRRGDMVTTGNSVMVLSKAGRRQELSDRKVRGLYNLGIFDVDKGNQCGAYG